jgi:hypothetical protein
LKINFAAELHGGRVVCIKSRARSHRWSNWKIALKAAEFKREDARELVWEFTRLQ